MKKYDVLKLSDTKVDNMIKIQGTQFERRLKLTPGQIYDIRVKKAQGIPMRALAREYNVNPLTIKYHTDETFKKQFNEARKGWQPGNHPDKGTKNRAAYKRFLVMNNMIEVE